MSGIEVAGLVLGAYPILVWTCEKYKDVFQGLEGWRAFRTRFENFTLSLETQRLCYRDVLKDLLILGPDPFIKDMDEIDAFLNNPHHEGWNDEDLKASLKYRLGEKYIPCMAIIDKMNGVMSELYKLLDIKRGQVTYEDDENAGWWQEKLERTRFSFSTKRFKKLDQLKAQNEDLERLIHSSDRLDILRAAPDPTALASFFKKIRDNACGLHAALKAGWSCDCQTVHKARLRLESRIQPNATPFSCMFEEGPGAGDSVVAKKHRELKFGIAKVPNEKSNSSNQAFKSVSFASNGSTLSKVSTNTSESSRTIPEVSFASNGSTRSVASSSTSRSSRIKFALSNNQSAESAAENDKPAKEGGKKTVKFSNFLRRDKEKKIASRTSTSTSAAIPTITVLGQSNVENHESKQDTGATKKTKVQDLCHTIWSLKHGDPSTYYLQDDEEDSQYNLCTQADPPREGYGLVNLESLLAGSSGWKLSKRQRVVVADALASSLLQLQKTPWLPDGWRKKDIWFLYEDSSLVEQPYVAQEFASTKVKKAETTTTIPDASTTTTTTTAAADATAQPLPAPKPNRKDPFDTVLIRFGILLLELCFGETIESRVRKQWSTTTTPSSPQEDARYGSLVAYTAALKWSTEVCDEFPDFESPIERCLRESFGERVDWGSAQFVQKVYMNLAKPLRESLVRNGWS